MQFNLPQNYDLKKDKTIQQIIRIKVTVFLVFRYLHRTNLAEFQICCNLLGLYFSFPSMELLKSQKTLACKRSLKLQEIWVKAEKHRVASRVGTPVQQLDFELCPCCGQVIQKQPISMWEHTKEFETYGFGYPLWFSFLKYCIILMLVLIASKTANELYMAANENWDFCYGQEAQKAVQQVHGLDSEENSVQENQNIQIQPNKQEIQPENYSSGEFTHGFKSFQSPQSVQQPKTKRHLEGSLVQVEKCTSFMVFLSIFKGEKMSENYFLKGVQFFIHLVALLALRNMILKEEQYYDERTTLISKYSIIIHNLPNVYGLKRKVQAMFEQEFGMYAGIGESEVKDIIYVFRDEELIKLEAEKEEFQDKLLKAQAEENEEAEKCARGYLQDIEQRLNKKTQQTRKQMDDDRIKCNKVIVVMRTEGDKASVLYSFKEALKEGKNFSEYFYDIDELNDEVDTKPTKIHMKEAPEPNEIIWEHIDESDQDRKLLIIQGYIFTFVFLAVITVVFYFVMLAKTQLFLKALELQDNDPNNPHAGAFKAFATGIVFVAILCVVLFNKFVMGSVLHKFVHMEHHAYTDKENHSFALKYALGMFFTTALMTLAVEAVTYQNFYSHPYGVIEEETIMFFVTAFIIPMIWLIHPYNVVKNLKKRKTYGRLMPQKQANQLVEYYPYMLGKRYAEIFEIIWFTFLYSQLIPLGSFLMFFGLIFYYWVDKYNFLRKSSVKERVSGKMAILGLKSLDATLFLSPAGELLFQGVIHHRFDYASLIFVILGIIYTIMPITSLIWQFNGQKYLIEQKPYEESKQKFKETYMSLHPIYKLTHSKEIHQHREIHQEFFKKDLKKIKHYGTGRGNYHRQMTVFSKNQNTVMETEEFKL